MKVGWVGLGKLGLPCALVMANAGHEVVGTDVNPRVKSYLEQGKIPYEEVGVEEAFGSGLSVGWRDSIRQVVDFADIVFVAVQTPHAPTYEGCSLTPDLPRDFDYRSLVSAVREIAAVCTRDTTVVVVSTVNPGTSAREIEPILERNPHISYVYSPAFIAMGTTMWDFANPEMVIAGSKSDEGLELLRRVHGTIHDAEFVALSIVECEMVKMTYNTFIGLKITFANLVGELCEKLGGDADKVTSTLVKANQRLISGKYLRSGMGDGGGCHPRDQLALSWLAKRLDLSFDLFDALMRARDAHALWQAKLCVEAAELANLPIRVCGREYKAESNLTVGSPSRLLMSLLPPGADWQDGEPSDGEPAVYFIGVDHARYREWKWPHGSVVLDPWGVVPQQEGVIVDRIGRI